MSRISFSECLWLGLPDEAKYRHHFVRQVRQAIAGDALCRKSAFSIFGQKPLPGIVRRITASLVTLAGAMTAASPQVAAQSAGIMNGGDLAITGSKSSSNRKASS